MNAVAVLSTIGILALGPGAVNAAAPPTRAEVEQSMGLRSEGDLVRGQKDTVGFVVDAAQARDVVQTAVALEQDALTAQDVRLGMSGDEGFVGGICPHDDHLYAGRVYVHLTERISAPRIILLGVFHRARVWNEEGHLVFDRFQAWHGPWGPVTVDGLREELEGGLAAEDYVVDNAMHCDEHSLEALVPFLQHGHPERTIVPILVPYMTWDRLQQLSDRFSQALATSLERHGWQLGRDVAVVVSSDAVHYGEDFDHAPFGTDAPAYEKAVARDRALATSYLQGALDANHLHTFFETLVDPTDVHSYRVPWCGRFSIPFGLEVLRKTAAASGTLTPTGFLLRYGTSLSEPVLPVTAATRDAGLGFTAPSNLHHWVGYAAVGYLPSASPQSR